MTPEQTANQNTALLMTIAAIIGALAWAGLWLLTSEHKIAVWFRVIMSRLRIIGDDEEASATALAGEGENALQPIATLSKPANEDLALGGLDMLAANGLGDITPEEARAIIRQQTRAEAIVAILRAAEAGKVKSAGDQAGLVEAVAGGARTSRPGTPYMLLKTLVDELRGGKLVLHRTPIAGRLTNADFRPDDPKLVYQPPPE